MKKLYLTIFAGVSLMIWHQNAFSQGRLSFKENKGQWNSEVLYRAQLPNGHIYLRKDGITYDFLSSEDMQALRERFHGTYEHQENDSGFYEKGPRHSSRPNGSTYRSISKASSSSASDQPLVIHGHAYRVNFLNTASSMRIVTDHKAKTKYNYLIGEDKSHWGQNVSGYGGVTYKGLYPNIDMHIYSNSEGLKYDLVVHPGGDYKDIQFDYAGADKMYIKKNQLYVKTSIGTNIEIAPYAYQVIDNKKVKIKVKYKLHDHILTFKPNRAYDPGYPLIIDPNFIFATFSGSKADNWGYTATYDAAGNFYMGGIVFGKGYPTTAGAYEVDFQGGSDTYGEGGFDISISKLSPDGKNQIYATYLGGGGDEQPHSLIVNKQNQLIISGRTNSRSYPGKKVGTGGGWDMVLTELTADGSGLVGSLIIGGEQDDGVNIADKYNFDHGSIVSLRRFYGDDARSEVNVDANGNILLVGSTQSDDFPVTSGVFQPNFGGTTSNNFVQQDAVVLKAAPDLSGISWASFLGGKDNDAAYVQAISKTGNIYVAGGTESSDFPGVSGDVIQSSYGGRVDGFISEITPDGKTLLRSTYLGTDQADQIYGIQTDKDGNVYVGGTTEGNWDDVFPGKVKHLKGVKYGKQFFCKFNAGLSGLGYSATFGSSNSTKTSKPNISPTAFLVDRCQNVYMSGWGGNIQPGNPNEYPNAGTYGLPYVNSLHLNNPDGHDFYFITMKKNAGGILFADTYGQNGGYTDHVDGGTSRFDPNGVIYQAICANCGGGTIFPTGPPGVVSRRNGSVVQGNSNFAQCNIVGFKIAFNLDGVRGGIAAKNRRSNYCFNEEVTFVDTLYGRPADAWNWEVFKGDTSHSVYGPETTDTSMFTHQFTSVGTYIIRLIKHDSTACIETDTSFTKIHIGDNPAQLKAVTEKLPPCKSFKYQFINQSTSDNINPIPDKYFTWNFGDGSGNKVQINDTTQHRFSEAGSYTVTLTLKDTAHFCNTPLDTSFVINASDVLEARMEVPDIFCEPDTHQLDNVSLGGTNYTWVVENQGVSDTTKVGDGSPLSYDFPTEGKYYVTLIAEDTVCQEKDVTKDSVIIYPRPTAAFNVHTSQPPGHNPPVNAIFHLENVSQSNFDQVDSSLTYEWFFGDGKSSEKKNPDHLYAETGTYQITLVVTNAAGCTDTVEHTVNEDIIPRLDVPSAFTPGSGDINGYAAPKAFGVKKIDFRIYNRWGEMVFHSNDPDITYIYQKGWDGTYKGKPQEMDAYAYVIQVIFYNGQEATKKGSITLVR